MHLNIQGVKNKLLDLQLYLTNHINNIGVICLNEHWLKKENIDFVNKLPNYKLADFYCRNDFNSRGGSCILVHNNMPYFKPRKDLKALGVDHKFEISAIEIPLINSIIISIYRVPYIDTLKEFLTKLQDLLQQLHKESKLKHIFIASDLNIDLKMYNTNFRNINANHVVFKDKLYKDFIDIIESNGYSINCRQTTRETTTSATCIDNIITNSLVSQKNVIVEESGLSDHKALFMSLPHRVEAERAVCYRGRRFRVINTETVKNFVNELSDVDWNVGECVSVDGNYNAFLAAFLTTFREALPLKATRAKKEKTEIKWITNGLIVSSKRKRMLHKEAKLTTDKEKIAYYKKYKKIFKKVVLMAKKMANDKFILRSSNKCKASWEVIKSELNMSQKSRKTENALKEISRSLGKNRNISEDFNKYFVNTVENMAVKASKVDSLNKMNNIKNNNERDKWWISFERVTTNEIKTVIERAKPKRSCGWDEISMWLIKQCKDVIIEPLTFIINQSLQTGCFPEKMKYGHINPIFKGGEELIKNFRPICLLPTFSKILETVVLNRLSSYLEVNNILTESQFGFRPNKSTNSALIDLTNHVLGALDGSLISHGLMCDLSRAFDCVRHDILIEKLKLYGVQGTCIKWFASYLNQRKQKTLLTLNEKTIHSSWKDISTGIPQGSVLGPLLFNVYVNDLPANCPEKIIMYADDTTAIITTKVPTESNKVIKDALESLNEWFSVNGLKLNKDKTKIINFSTRNKSSTNISVKEDHVETAKLLGIVLDRAFKWNDHIEHIMPKLNKAIYNMSCLAPIVSRQIQLLVYFAYFQSIITYGIIIWGKATHTERVFKAQKKIVRIILGLSPRESCKNAFQRLGLLTFPCLYIFEMVKHVHENTHIYNINNIKHNHHTRYKDNFRIPKHRLTLFENGPYYSGIQIYNKIPHEIKSLGSANLFYRKVRVFLVRKCYYSVEEFLQDADVVT